MILIVVFSLTLRGASIGLAELFHPDWSLLAILKYGGVTFGRIIFSLSLSMSIAFNYACYLIKILI